VTADFTHSVSAFLVNVPWVFDYFSDGDGTMFLDVCYDF